MGRTGTPGPCRRILLHSPFPRRGGNMRSATSLIALSSLLALVGCGGGTSEPDDLDGDASTEGGFELDGAPTDGFDLDGEGSRPCVGLECLQVKCDGGGK